MLELGRSTTDSSVFFSRQPPLGLLHAEVPLGFEVLLKELELMLLREQLLDQCW
jgi:hypothetical protein